MIILNILAIPFAILGFINIARGFFSVMENDQDRFEKEWKYGVYFVSNILGYLAIGLVIVQMVKFQ